ncbi:MAG: hypothetical protein A2365_01395 [Candidatus Nealsonbacteria bacterium RIFOXYB1_FULL_40_15]|uniref:Uncharacterized protein n=2 Tax=Candidatus Nealsoniibacteriota TaxID=1817911 RepID=A0A1G2ER95_9BACT|nr:MAG: hypothetical protein A2365_01395 [Candidatus Nealsonbacteria bacterium RIFOXYB1_FULL_40_15]OGZ27871.1 MAG: hypothetical protein A2427_04125 [Candidatus Nealsonbacteria bacterium RIFOXYC1_FULL_40_7]OGZ28030.1 MAG: hypothetical protein A2562_01475 [Candidatus Nealsonbacteria bacterium RIFOXYD1_FULL_39_11]
MKTFGIISGVVIATVTLAWVNLSRQIDLGIADPNITFSGSLSIQKIEGQTATGIQTVYLIGRNEGWEILSADFFVGSLGKVELITIRREGKVRYIATGDKEWPTWRERFLVIKHQSEKLAKP